jgi:deazaflavin-dependent oxidoreductase (nitroreductase family)
VVIVPTTIRRFDPPTRRGWLFRSYARVLGTTRAAMWFSRTVVWRLDPVVMRLTRGRVGLALALPTAVLETRGAKTGAVRRHAVIYFHDGDLVTIVASKFGYPENPAWFHNVVAHPDVLFGEQRYHASIVTDEKERERLWSLADRVFPAFAIYRSRAEATGRVIPIVQLEAR